LTWARDPASKPTLLQSAVEGHVLVKNTNHTLTLRKPKFYSVFSYDGVVVKKFTGRWMRLDNILINPDGTLADYTKITYIITSSADPALHVSVLHLMVP
jgi:hypothetical protein